MIYKITNKIVCIQHLLREDEKNEEKQIQKEKGYELLFEIFFHFFFFLIVDTALGQRYFVECS
jgi:hypothetical protein